MDTMTALKTRRGPLEHLVRDIRALRDGGMALTLDDVLNGLEEASGTNDYTLAESRTAVESIERAYYSRIRKA